MDKSVEGAASSGRYRVGIDVGGTFVDFVLVSGNRIARSHKELSAPADLAGAVLRGLDHLADSERLPRRAFLSRLEAIVHGTTATTNALITGDGAKTALLTTQGLRDALEMRRGLKEEVHNLKYKAPEPLVPRFWRIGIEGRLDSSGSELAPLDTRAVRAAATRLRAEGAESVAICFMHSYTDPVHEETAAAEVATAWPDAHIVPSTAVMPQVRFYDRVSTTVMSAYVGPLLARYLTDLDSQLSKAGFSGALLIVNSAAGVMSAEVAKRSAASTIASGPASGPVAASRFSTDQGFADCTTMDMGGTSLDASVVRNGQPHVIHEGVVDRRAIGLPMVAVESIGAGGGSIAWLDAGRVLRVGPRSAGAVPGPASYGLGGSEPTVTDADLLLGYLDADRFLGGRLRLDVEAARSVMTSRLAAMAADPEEAAAGIYEVVNANMAGELRRLTLSRGLDVREAPLIVSGGAGPLHAAAIGAELGVPRIMIPRQSSTFCALGALFLDYRQEFVRSLYGPVASHLPRDIASACSDLERTGRDALASQAVPIDAMRLEFQAEMRYERQLRELVVGLEEGESRSGELEGAVGRFHELHEERYGYSAPDLPVELVNLRVVAVGDIRGPDLPEFADASLPIDALVVGTRDAYVPAEGRRVSMPVLDGSRMTLGHSVASPAILVLDETSVLVLPPYELTVDRLGTFTLTADPSVFWPSELVL